jgi:hypothetical protein
MDEAIALAHDPEKCERFSDQIMRKIMVEEKIGRRPVFTGNLQGWGLNFPQPSSAGARK